MKLRSFAVALFLLILAATLVSSPKSPFADSEKAFYADPNLLNFVRPGLEMKIVSAEILADNTIRARVKLTDRMGAPLDRLGVNTPGVVAVSFVAATIPNGQTQYVAYTTRTQTSPITRVSAVQAGSDTGGTWTQVADGEYLYTFGTKAPATLDRAATHSIHIYGNRNLSEFDLGVNYDDDVFTFLPAGGTPTVTRDIIKSATCNKCHDQLAFHGGSRRSLEGCVMCHTPQTTDPDTGNTVNMPEMIHRIHRGKDLPSVKAGKPYIIIGNAQSVHDYSKIGFSAYPGVNNCNVCHEQGKGAKQEAAYLKPNRAACGACHDDVNFATGVGHVGLPQISDNQCTNCHVPQGELDFDASIMGAHMAPRFSKNLPGTVFEINGVTGAAPGGKPTVTFTVRDKNGNGIRAADMTRLALVLAGPTSDYTTYVSEDVRTTATGTPDGRHTYTFTGAIPAGAKGSFSVGIEGYRNVTLLPGTRQETVVRDAGMNKVMHFSVDGTPVQPRRQIVSLDKCNACHAFLNLHGDNRNMIEQCVLCHNPTETDRARRPANAMPAETIDFRVMIHRIHTGKELGFPYSIYGFGNTENSYSEVGFPGNRNNCAMCHVNNSELVPLRSNLSEVTDPRGPLSPMGPTTAACTSCHSSMAAASHSLVNTSRLGESCAACHGPNADFAVRRVHAQ